MVLLFSSSQPDKLTNRTAKEPWPIHRLLLPQSMNTIIQQTLSKALQANLCYVA